MTYKSKHDDVYPRSKSRLRVVLGLESLVNNIGLETTGMMNEKKIGDDKEILVSIPFV